MPATSASPINSQPLALLRAVRDIMAAPIPAQGRLDQVVKTIAEGFASEVCSVYLLRAGDILELFASVGLNPGSVHLTRLSVGEGLVGEIALTGEAVNLAEAAQHPKFVYRPETGEEVYHSFTGVPILQAGRAIGVLVVQGKEARSHTPEQLEVLQTVAMVLSELAVSNQFVSLSELETASSAALMGQSRTGLRLSPGAAHAPAVMFESRLAITELVAADTETEKVRLEQAVSRLQSSLTDLIDRARYAGKLEEHDILEAHLLLTQDKGWRRKIDEAVASGLTAEAAVRKVEEELRARMAKVGDPYIRERMNDVEELSNRLIHHLIGEDAPAQGRLPAHYILVARSLGPAELLNIDPKSLCGLVLEEGSASSHTAVIARALDIPALAGVERATSLIRDGDMLILNADAGEVHIRPPDEALRRLEEKRAREQARKARYALLRDQPAVTQDGTRISLNINAGLHADAAALNQEGVDGIGLYRTELSYLASAQFPDAAQQEALYRSVLEQAGGKRVVFRSFDIGGDKAVPYLRLPREENPAMGWRGARIALDRPLILRRQLQALLAASAGRELSVLFPFVALASEMREFKALLHKEAARMRQQGREMPHSIRAGVMIEMPALLWQLPELLKEVEFAAIGSNDLFQFLFACDRGSPAVHDRYDTLSPPMLRAVRDIASACTKAGVELSFCGDMARRPLEALALVGCGVRSLSMPASGIAPVKEALRAADTRALASFLDTHLPANVPSLRTRLQHYAQDRGIPV